MGVGGGDVNVGAGVFVGGAGVNVGVAVGVGVAKRPQCIRNGDNASTLSASVVNASRGNPQNVVVNVAVTLSTAAGPKSPKNANSAVISGLITSL